MTGAPAMGGARGRAGADRGVRRAGPPRRHFTIPALLLVWAGCRPLAPPVVVDRPGLPAAEPLMRIGVSVEVPQVAVGGTTPYTIAVAGGPVLAGAYESHTWTFTADPAGRITGRRGDGATIGPVEGLVHVTASAGGAALIDGTPYRGGVLIRDAGGGRVTAINLVELESYLLGVVPAEIPSLELEAVKSQAVAARTYAIAHMGRREAAGFDLLATVADQVYGGLAREDPMATRAVLETRGEVILYGGMPILAYYHSTCGGRTAAIEDVWRRAPLPYLRPVSDVVPGTDRAYCDASTRYRWETTWSGDQLRAALSRGLGEHLRLGPVRVDRVEAVEVTGYTGSQRVEALDLSIDGRDYRIRGDSIRWVLRAEPDRILNSAMILDVEVDRNGGAIDRLTVRGGGWGHGIGMCQFGAIGRARVGQRHREILTTYYRGTEVVRLY